MTSSGALEQFRAKLDAQSLRGLQADGGRKMRRSF
jgi:hypothetical protein